MISVIFIELCNSRLCRGKHHDMHRLRFIFTVTAIGEMKCYFRIGQYLQPVVRDSRRTIRPWESVECISDEETRFSLRYISARKLRSFLQVLCTLEYDWKLLRSLGWKVRSQQKSHPLLRTPWHTNYVRD